MCFDDNLVFVDTCIIIELCKNVKLFDKLKKYLQNNDMKIMVSDILCLELTRKSKFNESYYDIIKSLPHIITLPCDKLLQYEILSYPHNLKRTVEYFEIIEPVKTLEQLFLGKSFNSAYTQYEKDKKELLSKIITFKKQKYNEAWQVAYVWCINYINNVFPIIFDKIKDDPSSVNISSISSSWIQSYIAFEKYLVEDVEPIESDLGDFFHLSYIPYSKLAITEEKICNLLNIIQQKYHSDIIKDIKFRDIGFIKSLS